MALPPTVGRAAQHPKALSEERTTRSTCHFQPFSCLTVR
jgi:hypothetical protein